MVVIMKRTDYFFFLGLALIFVGFASLTTAENFGFGKTEDIPINYSLIPTVNNSDYFDSYSIASLWTYYTGLGNALWCQLTGCTMAGDINMGGNNINNIVDVVATGTGRFDGGILDNTNTLTIDLVNKYLKSGGQVRGDWSGMSLFDGSTNLVYNWNSREFYANDGADVILNHNAVGVANFDDSTIQTTGDINQLSDSSKICQGISSDYCSNFNGSAMVFNSEISTPFYWTNALEYNFDNNISIPLDNKKLCFGNDRDYCTWWSGTGAWHKIPRYTNFVFWSGTGYEYIVFDPTNGRIYNADLVNLVSANNAQVKTETTGVELVRNVADSNPAVISQQQHASSTGDIHQFKNSSGINAWVDISGKGSFRGLNVTEGENITMKSPDGTFYSCGVVDGGAFVCV